MDDLPEDILSDYLQTLQMRAAVFADPTVCGNWQVSSIHMPGPSFHLIARGNGWLHLNNGAPPAPLQSGDLLVFPRGAWHMLAAGPEITGSDSRSKNERGEGLTKLICGSLNFATQSRNPVLDALPEVLVLSTRDGAGASTLGPLVQLLGAEAARNAPGRRAVLDRLAEVLFINLVRHVMREQTGARGMLAALADPRIGRALAAFHHEPGRKWQLDEISSLVGMSRSSFSSHFQSVMNLSPMQYLAQWRMSCAEVRLNTTRQSVAQIAGALGYETEAAFRRAFKRHRGVAPGAIRHAEKIAHSARIETRDA